MTEINLYLHLENNNTAETMEINLYLQLNFNNTTDMMEINFIFTFRLQQCHEDDGDQFYHYIEITTIPRRRCKSI